ncbi:MAG: hypothetical protein KGJ62_11920 [Armatimonadetes bacterium]|nr:hypothetical protein [Armatimonadota bacterium]MDE2206416.1 hypothetical protein [Armatimonadota bacterium]
MLTYIWPRLLRVYALCTAAAVLVLVVGWSIWWWSLRLRNEHRLESDKVAYYHDPNNPGRITMMLIDLESLGQHRAAVAFASDHLTGGPHDDWLRLAIADDEWAEGDHAAAQSERAIVARSKSPWFADEARYDLAHPDSGP